MAPIQSARVYDLAVVSATEAVLYVLLRTLVLQVYATTHRGQPWRAIRYPIRPRSSGCDWGLSRSAVRPAPCTTASAAHSGVPPLVSLLAVPPDGDPGQQGKRG